MSELWRARVRHQPRSRLPPPRAGPNLSPRPGPARPGEPPLATLLVHLAGQSGVQTGQLAGGLLGARPGRPGGDRPLEAFTVDDDVEPLVEEGDEPADLRRVVLRLLVG